MRKKRSDRNHIVYEIRNDKTEEIYIGITAIERKAVLRSLKNRWKKHLSRFYNQKPDWNLYRSIETWGETAFQIRIIEIIRGKAKAHQREVEIIKERKPQLNSTHKY